MIALVTDSNSQIPPGLRQQFAVRVVPLTVTVDGQQMLEGDEIDADAITAALRRGAAVGSSTPSPGEFLKAYEQAAADGATAVLSVHTGGSASSTANTARLAAGMAQVPVEVVDTGTASFPVTLCTWSAGDVLAGGGSLEEAAEAARRTAGVVDNVFIVGTLALAAKGGRLADGVSGTPVLALTGGQMRPVGQVDDVDEAVAAMAAYVVEQAAGRRLRIGVGHLGAGQLADALEAALRGDVEVEQLVRYVVGPSVAVHTGLGTVGCVFHPAP